jgi:preprotein translocase subunit SecG
MLYYLMVSVFALVCLLLIVVILLQQGKGGDIASAFGGGSSQAAFGARAGATLLTKMTAGLAAAFILLALVLSVVGQRGTSSVSAECAGGQQDAVNRSAPAQRCRACWQSTTPRFLPLYRLGNSVVGWPSLASQRLS